MEYSSLFSKQDNLINNGFDSQKHKSIDFKKEDKIDKIALKKLIIDAIKLDDK